MRNGSGLRWAIKAHRNRNRGSGFRDLDSRQIVTTSLCDLAPSGKSIMAPKLPTIKDPVCGMTVNVDKALYIEYQGKTYHFCSPACRTKFLASHVESGKKKRRGLQDIADGDFGLL